MIRTNAPAVHSTPHQQEAVDIAGRNMYRLGYLKHALHPVERAKEKRREEESQNQKRFAVATPSWKPYLISANTTIFLLWSFASSLTRRPVCSAQPSLSSVEPLDEDLGLMNLLEAGNHR